MNTQAEVPNWVKQGRNLYEDEFGKKRDPILYTNIFRGQTAAEVIERDIAPRWPKDRTFSICIVGPGVDASMVIHQAYEPYVIAARLEAASIPYAMTIIDRNTRPLEDIRKRRTMFYYRPAGASEEPLGYWRRYLTDTRQKDNTTHTRMTELEFRSALPTVSEYLAQGFHYAHVPETFISQLDSGNIALVNGDIVTLKPQFFGSPDLITCSNVLMYMEYLETQMAALWNMSRAISPGGSILLNDFEDDATKSILATRGGWLTEPITKT